MRSLVLIFLLTMGPSVVSFGNSEDGTASEFQILKVHMDLRLLRIKYNDQAIADGVKQGRIDFSKVSDPKVEKNYLIQLKLDRINLDSEDVNLKVNLLAENIASPDQPSTQIVEKIVTMINGRIVTPINVECMAEKSDNSLGMELNCPESLELSIGLAADPSEINSKWLYHLDFSKSVDKNGMMTKL